MHLSSSLSFFFFNDTATTEIYTLSLHDALPISPLRGFAFLHPVLVKRAGVVRNHVKRLLIGRDTDPVRLARVGDNARHVAVRVDSVHPQDRLFDRLVTEVAGIGELDAPFLFVVRIMPPVAVPTVLKPAH